MNLPKLTLIACHFDTYTQTHIYAASHSPNYKCSHYFFMHISANPHRSNHTYIKKDPRTVFFLQKANTYIWTKSEYKKKNLLK